ncbi:MAG: NAD(P)H-dependent glycerol-3-phosphate dehydrogenase [Flavobacteriaceae bacterium]|jgi:glycerol-3-phosphate dehydrogenase (NAD(P)+)|nr:NAD(P)H-dependent glycerol-3-phosphate dehydrogenase [Flavobacteriaceae bacterium]
MQNLQKPKIGVIGNGSWATAIVKMLCENLESVNWWVRTEYTKGFIENQRHNPKYLTGVEFHPEKIRLTTDINELVKNSDYIILAVPSIYLQEALNGLTENLSDKIIFSAVKGIIPEIKDVVGVFLQEKMKIPKENIGIITGPSHAEEVAMERLSYLTIAALSEKTAKNMADCLGSRYIKTTLSDDIFGTEYASVLKNIFAIASGIARGLGYGDNFQAVLISNAIREMKRFLDVVFPTHRDINNSAYLGDLLVTGYSSFSRNRLLGNMIGKGYTVRSAILEMNMVAEGYYAAQSIYEKAKIENINMPITKMVYQILYEGKNPDKELIKLCVSLN